MPSLTLKIPVYLKAEANMKILKSTVIFLCVLTVFPLLAQIGGTQISSWIQPEGGTSSMTSTLSSNQVMEILSISVDASTAIEITIGEQTTTFGSGGNLVFPYPFIIAGPATVSFKKTSTGGSGGMITYRISPKGPATTSGQ